MIGLDFSEMDQSVLAYASYMSKYIGVEKVYFVNISPTLNLGDDFMKEYNLENLSSDEKIVEKMKVL